MAAHEARLLLVLAAHPHRLLKDECSIGGHILCRLQDHVAFILLELLLAHNRSGRKLASMGRCADDSDNFLGDRSISHLVDLMRSVFIVMGLHLLGDVPAVRRESVLFLFLLFRA